MFLFIAVGIIYTGTSFPGLRTREKSFSFLLNPVSAFEKYVFEFLSRIVLFIIVMPIIFWLVYLTEGFFAELIIPDYDFVPVSFLWNGFSEIEPAEYYGWVVMLVTSLTLLIFNIPFTGATIFTKYPLLKTLFAIAVIFFFHAFLIFFFVEILNFKDYGHSHMSILGIKDAFGALKFFTIYSIIVNAGLIATAYLKLKEKEV